MTTPRPRKPQPIDESRIPSMTRRELHDLLLPAVEWYQALLRWPNLTPKQDAEYEVFWRLYRTYFHPADAIGAALGYVQTGHRGYWEAPAMPREGS